VDHDGGATAEKECGRVKGRKGRTRKVHRGFFKEAHLNGGPLISGAAQEGRVMFLEGLVERGGKQSRSPARPANRGMPSPLRERGGDRRKGIQAEKQRERGPTGEVKDGRDRAGGLGGDCCGGLSLAIRTSASGTSKNDAAVSFDREGGESVRRKDCVGGDEKPAFVQREREISRRRRRCGWCQVRDASVDEEAGIINVGGDAASGRAAAGLVTDPNGKGIAGREEGGPKANGIQQGAKSVRLLATSGHVGDSFALTEQRRRTPVGILEPVEQFWRILGEAGADDEATRDGVESVLVIQREENEIVKQHQLCHANAYFRAVLDANSELNGKEGVADPIANLGQCHPTNEAIPGWIGHCRGNRTK
jgi:hypothetical protein